MTTAHSYRDTAYKNLLYTRKGLLLFTKKHIGSFRILAFNPNFFPQPVVAYNFDHLAFFRKLHLLKK